MGILQLRQNTFTVIEWLRREHKWDHNNLIRQSCIPLLWPVVVPMEQISEWEQRANIDVGTWCLHQPFHMRLSTWFWKWFFWNLQQIELVHIYYYKNINKYKQQIHAFTLSFIHSKYKYQQLYVHVRRSVTLSVGCLRCHTMALTLRYLRPLKTKQRST